MLRSILKIGEIQKVQGAEFPIEQAKLTVRQDGREKGYGVKIIFDLDDRTLDFEHFEYGGKEAAKKKAEEFLLIGNPRGNPPQLRLTTDDINYLLNPGRGHKWGIGAILKYIEENGLSSDNEIKELYQYLEEVKRVFFANNEDLTPSFSANIAKKKIKMKQIALYTVSIKKRGATIDLAKEPGYRKLLHHVLYKVSEKALEDRIGYGVCHVCGNKGNVLINPDYPKGTFLGIYVTDKIGFLSNVEKTESSLLRTHVICSDCREKLILGMNYIDQNLSFNVGDLGIWIIPTIPGRVVTPKPIDARKIIDACKKAFEMVRSRKGFKENFEEIKEIEKKLDIHFKALGLRSYILNIVFGRAQQSRFIFHGLIQDTPVTRFIEIGEASEEIAEKMDRLLPSERGWSLGFDDICNIFPLIRSWNEQERRYITVWKPLIELFDAMISGTYYPREHIVKRAMLYARMHRFGNYGGYNIREVNEKNREEEMCRGLLLYNSLLRLLAKLGVIWVEMPKGSLELEGVDEDIVAFCNEQGYFDWQAGLFLLGVLIGKIGLKQYKDSGRKTILNKINFNGMSLEKIKWLAIAVLESLKNYKLLDEPNEVIYTQAKRLIDKNLDSLKNSLDNVFYVISGYSYVSLKYGGWRK